MKRHARTTMLGHMTGSNVMTLGWLGGSVCKDDHARSNGPSLLLPSKSDAPVATGHVVFVLSQHNDPRRRTVGFMAGHRRPRTTYGAVRYGCRQYAGSFAHD